MRQNISPYVLASAAVMAAAIRSLSACEIISNPYQLPDDPPPPNEPPPPEKPPAPKNPPPAKTRPEEPEDQPDRAPDDQPLEPPPRDRPRPRSRGMAPTSVRNTNPNTTKTSSIIGSESQRVVGSGRFAARCCHSAASPVSTLMMSSTPRVIPPAKPPARNRGVISFSMISRETASVRAPSSP